MDQLCITARGPAFEFDGVAPAEFMWMPAGIHTIHASKGDQPIEITIKVDPSTAATAQQALEQLIARGQKPFFDFEHREREASAWPQAFTWRDTPAPGVYVSVTWSKDGAEAVAGRTFRGFSPAFKVSSTATSPEHPAAVIGLPLVMGGLTNIPAFHDNLPLWARHSHDHVSTSTNPSLAMSAKELDSLKSRLASLEADLQSIKAKKTDGMDQAQLQAHQVAQAAAEAETRAARAELRAAELEAQLQARNAKLADDAIKAAVQRGALPAQNTDLHAKYRSLIERDPANAAILEALPANPALAEPITAGRPRVQRVAEDIRAVMRAFEAERDPIERGLIYARDLRARLNDPNQVDSVIMAADTYSTTLVVQRTLDLLKWNYPLLGRITSDFSSENASYGDAITTRVVGAPTVGTYHTTNGYSGANATTTDVAVTMNAHKYVQVEFNANVVASTRRRLYEEQVETSQNGLAKDISDALLALIVTGTFTNTPVTEALVDMDRATVIGLAKALTEAKVPLANRTLLLNPAYYAKLAEDTSIVSALINTAAGSAITTGRLPNIHGFEVIEQPNLPSTGNLSGFAFNRSALVLATRVPTDYAAALPAAPATGSVQIVTNPEDGFSVAMTQYVDHDKGKAKWRIAIMYGVAAGQVAAGTILRSAS